MDLAAIEADLRRGIGQTRTAEDHVVPALVERLAVTLETGGRVPGPGELLPPGWHTIFCLRAPARADLETDGLPRSLDQIPAVPMQRRMFGGARLTFHEPLLVGQPVTCVSEMTDVKTRTTAAGHLAIVTLRHRYSGPAGLAVTEEQDIVHMEPIAAPEGKGAERAPRAEEPPPAPTWQRTISPDPVMLFRFSALTFNSHRIHYDAPYSAGVEKLPGLMVQGKLIALQLLETVRISAPGAAVKRFEYRSGRPLFAGGPCSLQAALDASRTSARLWAQDGKGSTVQSASLAFAGPVPA